MTTGNLVGFRGPNHFAKVADLAAKNKAVEEQQGGQSLILRQGADMFFQSQMG